MGLMTGLALGGMATVAFMQGRKNAQLKQKLTQGQQPLAPAPLESAALTPPTPPVLDAGAKQAAGNAAGLQQRKRAAGGSLLTSPKPPASSAMPVPANPRPRSLVGY